MNHYRTSDGNRILKAKLDREIRKAKKQVIENQLNEHGYNFCSVCGIASGVWLDCAHIESVDSCQKNGRAEKAADPDNIKLMCRECHQLHDHNFIIKP